jgi:hypothetical protein
MVAKMTPLRLLIMLSSLAMLVGIASLAASHDSGEAVTFNPHATVCLDDPATVDPDPLVLGSPNECDGNNAAGAAADITTTFGINKPDSNFGAVVGFTPTDWGVKKDSDVADGTLAAQLTSLAVLGLINNACTNMVRVDFDMKEATTNMASTVTFEDQWEESGGLAAGVTKYPDYLTRVLTTEVNGSEVPQPRARYYGQTSVSGVDVSLNFVLYEPGVRLRGTTFAPQLGYPSVTVLQNIGDPEPIPAPSAITDFCSPLETSTTTFKVVRSNPAADGSYTFVSFTQSQRDADNDGIENGMDSCPTIKNPGWDPRDNGYPGDRDHDRLPDNCDDLPDDLVGPPPNGRTNDHDGDGYYNAQDNCPLARNSKDIENALASGDNNQADRDFDGIGDSCDTNPDTADGEPITRCLATVVDIGAGGTPTLDKAAIESLSSYSPCGTDTGAGPSNITPTPGPGGSNTSGGGGGGGGGVGGGPTSGIGSLSPAGSSLPAWAAALVAVGIAGILGSAGFALIRVRRRP